MDVLKDSLICAGMCLAILITCLIIISSDKIEEVRQKRIHKKYKKDKEKNNKE